MGKWDGWRGIVGFPNYQINSDGDIRVRSTWLKLKEQQNKKTGAWYYQLVDKNGKQTKRNYLPLLYTAWPELLEAWREIPGYPNYLIDRNGEVMGTKFFRPIPMMSSKNSFTYNLHQWGQGRKKTFNLLDFDWTVFDDYENIEYYQMQQARVEWRSVVFLNSHEVNAKGEIRNKIDRRPTIQKEYFSAKYPGVLFIKVGPRDNVTYLRVDNIMASAWPELQEQKAA